MTLLGEAPGMLGFLFAADDAVALEPEAVKALRDDAAAVLDAALAALALVPADGFVAEPVHVALQEAIVDALGIKPRFAFAPLRTAISGRRVSPPLFESMEILGKDSSIARLAVLRETLG
jgi:glutamyl-tRNA synthetase